MQHTHNAFLLQETVEMFTAGFSQMERSWSDVFWVLCTPTTVESTKVILGEKTWDKQWGALTSCAKYCTYNANVYEALKLKTCYLIESNKILFWLILLLIDNI